MKKLLALALVAMMAGGALADAQIGVFFSPGATAFEMLPVEDGVVHPQTIISVTPFVPFRINVVAYGIEGMGAMLEGYELGIVVPVFGFPQGAWNFMGEGPGLDNAHPTEPGSYSRAHAWSVPKPIVMDSQVLMWVDYFPTTAPAFVEYKLGPYDATAVFPKLLVDGQIVFCEVGPDYNLEGVVASNGFAVVAGTEGIVATENMSWSNVKSLFN
jgi:hypothetical protein